MMKTSLLYLPEYKQQEILKIIDIIKDVVAPEMIILFGSYAKGTQVEHRYIENGIRYEYISDYDYFVITKDDKEKDYILSDRIVNRARNITNVAVNCIIHDIDYVNEGLSIGQYFFTDIINEGVLLYDSGRVEFVNPKEMSLEEQRQIADGYFKEWFNRASTFLKGVSFYLKENDLKISAFTLHQATESFYNTILLVCTGYKPKTHSLEKLRQYAKPFSKVLLEIFPVPTDDKLEIHLFDLLKRGYIDARYKHDYYISKDELETLIKKVRKMQEIVEDVCNAKIDSLHDQAIR